MLFNSYVFLLLFFPVTLAGYYLLKKLNKINLMKLWLTGMSLWFYGYFNPWYLYIIVGSILVNYGLCIWMDKCAPIDSKPKFRKIIMIFGVLFNVGILFYYKYFNFFIDNVNLVLKTDIFVEKILLPLGISFFTFQEIGCVVDAYRGEVGKLSLLDYSLFITFFPQLIAGPIVTQDEMLPQLNNMHKLEFSSDKFARGMVLFILGLIKKVLIADVFGNAVNWAYANTNDINATSALLAVIFANIQMYFDFSGYCDMARGIGKMFMLDIIQNFNSPYKSQSVTEFWSRWQITMSRFLTKYIYFPLGGSRKGELRTYINTLIVFTISGIWHGAGWKYLIWGVGFGALSCGSRLFKNVIKKTPRAVNIAVTFFFVGMMCGLFTANDTRHGLQMLSKTVTGGFGPVAPEMLNAFMRTEYVFVLKRLHILDFGWSSYIMFGIYCIVAFYFCFVGPNANEIADKIKFKFKNSVLLMLGFIWCLVSLSEVSTFLYFNF